MNELCKYWEEVFKKEAGIVLFGKNFNVVRGREGNVMITYSGIEHIMGRDSEGYYIHNPNCEARMGAIRNVLGDSLDIKIDEICFNEIKYNGVLVSKVKDLTALRSLFGKINSALRT